jgi:hypothetical protein
VSRARLNIFLEPDHARRLEELATLKGVSKSGIIAAALATYLSPDGPDQRSTAVQRRLDVLSRQFDHLERDQTVLLETVALWVRHQLAVSTPVPEGLQETARAQGRARFADFVAQLARHLQRGGSLVGEVWREITPQEAPRAFGVRTAHGDGETANGERSTDGALA